MQKSIWWSLPVILLLLLSGVVQAAQDTYYVQSVKARILSEPSFKAKVIGESTKGTKLLSSGREGSWIKVVLYQKEGYVSALLLSKTPPLEKQRLIKGEGADIKQSVRRRASTYTSAAAARGLAQDDRRRLSTEEKSDYLGLEKMESFSVSSEEVARFMEGNK
jgi:hypothetical protein